MTTSRKALLEAGLAALGHPPTPREMAFLKAIAAMLAEQQKKPAKKKASKAPFTARELFELVKAEASDKIACDPYDAGWFPRLQTRLNRMPELTREDRLTFVEWLCAGELFGDSYSFEHVVTHFPNWMSKARRWKDTEDDGGLAAAFKRPLPGGAETG